MPTNVFVSRPSKLPRLFEAAYDGFHKFLKQEKYAPRRLGSTDYSLNAPMQAIIRIMDECDGVIVLGYPQIEIFQHFRRNQDIKKDPSFQFPTPWNQIEAALGYGAKLPVLVVAQEGIAGGIFDHGVTGEYVLSIDLSIKKWHEGREFKQVYSDWKSRLPKPSTVKKKSR